MELLQLKYFCDAAECENFSKTAEKNRVPTSNISQTVKRLETELGVQLFRRGPNKISLSDEGRIFYNGARRALFALEEAVSGISETGRDASGEIKLLIRAHRRILASAIERFKNEYPKMQISINHDRDAAYSDYSFIISDGTEQREHYTKERLLTERVMLAVTKTHPLASRKKIEISELADEGFICMSHGSSLADLSIAICRAEGFNPKVVINAEDPYYVRKYVEMGLGIALVPEISWRGMFSENTAFLDIGDYKRVIYLYTQSDKVLSHAERAFADMIKEVFDKEKGSTDEIN